MMQNTEHTYGFYLITQNRIQRDMTANRMIYHIVTQTTDTHNALLQLMDKYTSNKKSAHKVTKIITHNQIVSQHLDSEFQQLQSDFDRLSAYIQNNDDVAGRAYDAAYSEPNTNVQQTKNKIMPILTNIAKFIAQRTK